MIFRRGLHLLFALCVFACISSAPPASGPSSREIIDKTLEAIGKIQTLKFHLKCNERFNGKLIATESQIKLNISPRKVYIYLKGPELLWIAGKNNGDALVNPDGFPYINLNLDPMGSIMRENQHHTIHEAGFDYFAGIIKNSIALAGDKFDNFFKLAGVLDWDSHGCYVVNADYPDFKYTEYTVQKGETLLSIAAKLKLSEYMLLEINSDKVSNYHNVKSGQKIMVPNVYGKKLALYIDKELFVPRVIKVYDDKGLYEYYEYQNLEVNPKIADEEFTKEYKDYGF